MADEVESVEELGLLDSLKGILDEHLDVARQNILKHIQDELTRKNPVLSATACPCCGNDNLVCLDSRTRKDGTIRRVKGCCSCEERFATIEVFTHHVKQRANRKGDRRLNGGRDIEEVV